MAVESDRRTVVWGGLFALDLPPDWVWKDQESVISLFREPGGVGVLQISLARRLRLGVPSESEARELAESFADQRGWDLADHSIRMDRVSGFPISEFEFTEKDGDSSFWQVWNVVGSDRAAFITYTCDPSDAIQEITERKEIVRSFRWL